jgi:hypothetical protein
VDVRYSRRDLLEPVLTLGNFGAQSYDALELSLNVWGMEISHRL